MTDFPGRLLFTVCVFYILNCKRLFQTFAFCRGEETSILHLMSHRNSPSHDGTSSTNGPRSQTNSPAGNRSNPVCGHSVIAQSSDDAPGSYVLAPTVVRSRDRTQFTDLHLASVTPAAAAPVQRIDQPTVSTPTTTSGTNQSRREYPAEYSDVYRY